VTVRLFGTATTVPLLEMQLSDCAQVSHRRLWEGRAISRCRGPEEGWPESMYRDGPLRFGAGGFNSARESDERFFKVFRFIVGL
jgi:hypothetical protein